MTWIKAANRKFKASRYRETRRGFRIYTVRASQRHEYFEQRGGQLWRITDFIHGEFIAVNKEGLLFRRQFVTDLWQDIDIYHYTECVVGEPEFMDFLTLNINKMDKNQKAQEQGEDQMEERRPERSLHDLARAAQQSIESGNPPELSSDSPNPMKNYPGCPGILFNFGVALHAIKDEVRVRRRSWGSGIFVVMMPALYLPPYNTQDTARKVNDRTAKWIGEDQPLDCQPYIAHWDGRIWQPGWLPSQNDLFAEDWEIIR